MQHLIMFFIVHIFYFMYFLMIFYRTLFKVKKAAGNLLDHGVTTHYGLAFYFSGTP